MRDVSCLSLYYNPIFFTKIYQMQLDQKITVNFTLTGLFWIGCLECVNMNFENLD